MSFISRAGALSLLYVPTMPMITAFTFRINDDNLIPADPTEKFLAAPISSDTNVQIFSSILQLTLQNGKNLAYINGRLSPSLVNPPTIGYLGPVSNDLSSPIYKLVGDNSDPASGVPDNATYQFDLSYFTNLSTNPAMSFQTLANKYIALGLIAENFYVKAETLN